MQQYILNPLLHKIMNPLSSASVTSGPPMHAHKRNLMSAALTGVFSEPCQLRQEYKSSTKHARASLHEQTILHQCPPTKRQTSSQC